jgi:hypothetical protein
MTWGRSGDVPRAGNFVGDRRADYVVWRPSTGVWYRRDAATGTSDSIAWGTLGDVPAPMDCDVPPNGRLDLALWRPTTGLWYVLGDDGVTRRTFRAPRTVTACPAGASDPAVTRTAP